MQTKCSKKNVSLAAIAACLNLKRYREYGLKEFAAGSGESADVSQEKVDDWSKQLPGLTKDYEPKDIFNFDETGLFYECMPDKTFEFKSEKCFGGKSHWNKKKLPKKCQKC